MHYIVHGILQARILEWVAYPFSSGSSWPRNRTGVSCIAGGFFTNWAIRDTNELLWNRNRSTDIENRLVVAKGEGRVGEAQTESLRLLLLLSCFSRVKRKPTRLCHPWDSPGKNTGVGCHFLPQCMKVKSESEVTQSYPTLQWSHGLQPTRLLHPWDFPGKSTGVGCHCLLWVWD